MLPLAKFSWNSTSVLGEIFAVVTAHDCPAECRKLRDFATVQAQIMGFQVTNGQKGINFRMDKRVWNCFYRTLISRPNSPVMLINHSNRTFIGALSLVMSITAACLLPQTASAQFGVSPSQTSNFFNDFRGRSSKMKASAPAARSGDVVYDYESGAYKSQEDQEGFQSLQQLLKSDREISQPSIRSGSSAFAARSVGDYTTYSGQYSQALSYFAPSYTSDPFLSGKRNMKLGPVNIGLGLYQGFEYNSNVQRAPEPVSDFISSTMFNVSANYRVSQHNVLSVTAGIGVDHYFDHPEFAAYGNGSYLMSVLPGSTLAFDVKAGPVYITIYDRISVRPATNNAFVGGTNTGSFGVFQNDFGIAANWQINSAWALLLNYTNTWSNALGKNNEQFDRTMNSLHASLTYSPTATWILGTEGGVSLLDYAQPALNGASLYNWGMFVSMPIGKSTTIKLSGGLQIFEFDDPTVQAPLGPEDNTDLSSYYYNLSITNQLNARFSHTLTVGHESSINLSSNFVTADFVNYGLSMVAWKGGRFSLSGYFERAEPSFFNPAFAGAQADVSQYGYDFYYSHQISSKWRAGAGYHFGRSDSKAAGQDNDQHGFALDLNYTISSKAGMNFGYRYFITDSKGANTDSTQSRVILGFNYNF